jgi:hypothetical protein
MFVQVDRMRCKQKIEKKGGEEVEQTPVLTEIDKKEHEDDDDDSKCHRKKVNQCPNHCDLRRRPLSLSLFLFLCVDLRRFN